MQEIRPYLKEDKRGLEIIDSDNENDETTTSREEKGTINWQTTRLRLQVRSAGKERDKR